MEADCRHRLAIMSAAATLPWFIEILTEDFIPLALDSFGQPGLRMFAAAAQEGSVEILLLIGFGSYWTGHRPILQIARIAKCHPTLDPGQQRC